MHIFCFLVDDSSFIYLIFDWLTNLKSTNKKK